MVPASDVGPPRYVPFCTGACASTQTHQPTHHRFMVIPQQYIPTDISTYLHAHTMEQTDLWTPKCANFRDLTSSLFPHRSQPEACQCTNYLLQWDFCGSKGLPVPLATCLVGSTVAAIDFLLGANKIVVKIIRGKKIKKLLLAARRPKFADLTHARRCRFISSSS